MSFVNESEQLKSNLQFVPFTLEVGTDKARLNGMARIVQQVFPQRCG